MQGRMLLIAGALLSVFLVQQARAGELKLGDPAPTLRVSKFVKGTPVTKFMPGKLYVVEFWATWYGPCRASIPHLTEMAKKYKDVQFVGVSVFEHKSTDVEPFVKDMGDKMNYGVAMDEVPEGKTASDGFMAANWMTAANQDGIPTAFVIDKESRVAWIGRPMTIDEPLGKIVAGNWDIKTEAEKFAKENAGKKKMAELNRKISQALKNKDFNSALSTANDAIAEDPAIEQMLGLFKWNMLKKLGRTGDAHTYFIRLLDDVFKDNAMGINQLIWPVVDPDANAKPSPEDATICLKAAIRADELTKARDGGIADTLAAAYYAAGDIAKAMEAQERALVLAKGTPLEKDASLKQRLNLYHKGKA
jgi:thiol-disulfide isomerase/thioredoxin